MKTLVYLIIPKKLINIPLKKVVYSYIYSLESLQKATRSADVLIYSEKSSLPKLALVQGNQEDFQIYFEDNIKKVMALNHIKKSFCVQTVDDLMEVISQFDHEQTEFILIEELQELDHKKVISLQKLATEKTAKEVKKNYFSWLMRFLWPLLFIVENHHEVIFKLFNILPLLRLRKCHDSLISDRVIYDIQGGLLGKRGDLTGQFEFRQVENGKGIMINLSYYKPRLWWGIYKYTQAIIHEWTMNKFIKKESTH